MEKLKIGYYGHGFNAEYSEDCNTISIWTDEERPCRVAEVLLKTTCGPVHLPLPISEQDDSRRRAELFSTAPETAAERDHLRAVNAELMEAVKELSSHALICGHMTSCNKRFASSPDGGVCACGLDDMLERSITLITCAHG